MLDFSSLGFPSCKSQFVLLRNVNINSTKYVTIIFIPVVFDVVLNVLFYSFVICIENLDSGWFNEYINSSKSLNQTKSLFIDVNDILIFINTKLMMQKYCRHMAPCIIVLNMHGIYPLRPFWNICLRFLLLIYKSHYYLKYLDVSRTVYVVRTV